MTESREEAMRLQLGRHLAWLYGMDHLTPLSLEQAGTLVHRGQEHLDALVHAGVIEEEDGHCGCLGGEVYRLVSDPDRAQVTLAADPEDPTPIAAVVAAAAAFNAVLTPGTVTALTIPEVKAIERLQKALEQLSNPMVQIPGNGR